MTQETAAATNWIPHFLTVGGMLAVAIGGWIVQWKQSKYLVGEELRRLRTQIAAEAQVRQEQGRLDRLRELLAELVTGVEPENPEPLSYGEVVRLITEIQLTLDVTREAEARLNDTVNKLGLTMGGWNGAEIPKEAFMRLHAVLISDARQALGLSPLP